jgi:hypothetical protein
VADRPYLNAALTAFDVRKEIQTIEGHSVRVVYGVFGLDGKRFHALPPGKGDAEPALFGSVPSTSFEFTNLGDAIASAVLAQEKV